MRLSRFNGILETTRIRKLGYPIRYTFVKFSHRYKCLVQNNYTISPRDVTRMILTSYATDDYQLGSSKVFLREMLEQRLENARYDLTHSAAVTIQSAVRGYLARKRYRELIHSIVRIQAFYRMYSARVRYLKVKRGVIKLQALIRMKREKARYHALVKRMSRNKDLCVTGVNHLEIPAELAFMMSKIEHHEDQVVELVKISKSREFVFDSEIMMSGRSGNNRSLESFNFDKYVRVFFKSNFGMRREPIITPFLKESPESEALVIFKLILRFMNDPNLSGKRETLLMNYIVNKGMSNPSLRDEILVQILNQTKNNENKLNCDRGWVLLASCLSAFQPSDNLYSYLLNYSFVEHNYSSVLQVKLLQMGKVRGATRALPPFALEYRGIKNRAQMYVDVGGVDVRVESWSTVEDVAGEVAGVMGFGGADYRGFTLEKEHDGSGEANNHNSREVGSYTFVFDHVNEAPSKAFPFKFTVPELFGAGSSSQVGIKGVVPAGVPSNSDRMAQGYPRNGVQARILRGSGGNLIQNPSAVVTGKSRSMESLLSSSNQQQQQTHALRKLGLSSSKLNERYHSIDNLEEQQVRKQSVVSRKLSTDYFDLDEEEVVLSDEDEEDEGEEDIVIGGGGERGRRMMMMHDEDLAGSGGGVGGKDGGRGGSSGNSRIGNPRFIKSTAGGGAGGGPGMGGDRGSRTGGPGSAAMRSVGSSVYGSSSARMYIERGGGSSTTTENVYGMIKSSALSDTSEAPSLGES